MTGEEVRFHFEGYTLKPGVQRLPERHMKSLNDGNSNSQQGDIFSEPSHRTDQNRPVLFILCSGIKKASAHHKNTETPEICFKNPES